MLSPSNPARVVAVTSLVGALLLLSGEFILPLSFFQFLYGVLAEPSPLQVLLLVPPLATLTSLGLGVWACFSKPPRWLLILTVSFCLLGAALQVLFMFFLLAFNDAGAPILSVVAVPLLGLGGYLLSLIGACTAFLRNILF